MDKNILAFYMGYAFSHAIHVEQLLAPGELLVPYIISWQDGDANPVPYPAQTQAEAVNRLRSACAQLSSHLSAWTSGREGLVAQKDGTKLDVLLVEGWIPELSEPLEMFVYCRKDPFRLIHGFMWKDHPKARKNVQAFMAEFKNGILSHPFGRQCMEYIKHSEPLNLVR
jgi:hypothetical protein